MKSFITTSLLVLSAQTASAANVTCSTNVEKVPGSQVFDKNVHNETIEIADKSTMNFLLADGTVLPAGNMTPETLAKLDNSAKVFSVTFVSGKPTLMVARIDKKSATEVKYTNLAFSGSFDGKTAYLMANDLYIGCAALPGQK